MKANTNSKVFPEGYLARPVRRAPSVICGKWTLLILYELSEGLKRFNALKRDVMGISQRLLTAQLETLVDNCLVHRKVYEIVPPRVE